MSLLISGALINGAGIPMSGCHIILKSRVNTSEVVMRTVADVVTGNNGEYSFEAQTGKYGVYLKQDWHDEYCVGDISVYDDSMPGTLNDFLTAIDEGDLKPDVVKRFEEMVAQARQSAEAAAKSERLAGQYAADVAQAQKSVETLAGEIRQDSMAIAENVQKAEKLASDTVQNAARAEQAAKDADKIVDKAIDKLSESATLTGEAKASAEAAARSEQKAANHAQNAAGSAQKTAQDVAATETALDDAERYAEKARLDATATAEDRKATAGDVKSSGENAAAAKQSAQAAADSAGAAEQAKNDIDVTLAGTLKTVNHLSEIAAEGTEAQQDSRDNLGLKTAATKDVQTDIYDSTVGRVAIPGAFGFGGIIPDKYRVMFSSDKGPSEFINWVRETTPGKYLVEQYGGNYHQPIIKWDQWGLSSSTPFNGLVEIEIRTDSYNPARTSKHVTFKGYNGLIFSATVPASVNWTDFVKSWTLISLEPYYIARMLFGTDGWREGGAPKAAGGLTLAAYVGRTDDDNSRKLGRYTLVSGSRLRTLSIVTSSLRNSPSTPQLTIGDGLSGSYISLSGFLSTVVGNNEALVGLFIRSA